MGFENQDRTRRTFVNIINGKFAIKSDESNPKAVKRYSEKKQMDVLEIVHDTFRGEIKSLEIKNSDYGNQLCILMKDFDEFYEFQIPTESRYFTSFCDKIENVELAQDVKLVPYNFLSKTEKKPNGDPKRVTGINIFQGGEKIMNFYSKDNQGQKSKYPENPTEPNRKIYYIQVEEYFKELIVQMNLQLPDADLVKREMATSNVTEQPETELGDKSDDLPF